MTEYAIRLKDITKSYNMYAKPSDRFREASILLRNPIMMYFMR